MRTRLTLHVHRLFCLVLKCAEVHQLHPSAVRKRMDPCVSVTLCRDLDPGVLEFTRVNPGVNVTGW